jgi:YegS/Rv2252/BmrU family lipid kinase
VQVVINPAAGKSEPVLSTLNRVFREADVHWEVSVTHRYGDARRRAQEAVEQGCDIVAAYGGDGTVMEVANGLMGSEVPLGILPGGTGNVFSLELGLPQKLEDAARLICDEASAVQSVDVGQCGEDSFLLRVLVGYGARRVQGTTREMRDRYGKMAYFVAALQALSDLEPVGYRFDLDGKSVEVESFSCILMNAGNIGVPGVSLIPDVSVHDGLLDLVAMEDTDVGSLSSIAASIVDPEREAEGLYHWQAREIRIESRQPQPVAGDGEDWGETPVTAKVLPKALKVLVPATAS